MAERARDGTASDGPGTTDPPTFVCDDEFVLLDVDRRFCEFHGVARSDAVGSSVPDFYDLETDPRVLNQLRWINGWARRADGETVPVAVRTWDTQGITVGVVQTGTQRSPRSVTADEKIRNLHHAATDVVSAADVQDVYETAVETAETVLDFDLCVVSVAEDDGERLRLAAASDPAAEIHEVVPADEGIAGLTYRENRSVLVENATANPVATPASEEYASAVSVPVGETAVLQAVSTDEGYYDHRDLELAELLALHVEEAVDRVRSEGRLQATKDKIERLYAVTSELPSCESRQAVFDRMVGAAEGILGFEWCSMFLVEDGQFVAASVSADAPVDPGQRTISVEEGAAGHAYRTGEAEIWVNARDDGESRPITDEIESSLSVPVGDFGLFQAVSFDPDAYDRTDLELTELLAGSVARVCERIDAREALRRRRRELEHLVGNLPGVVYRTAGGPDTRLEYVSDGATELTGYSAVELVGDDGVDYHELVHPDERRSVRRERRIAVEREEPFELTYRIRTADDDWRWVQEQGSAVVADGELLFVEGFVSDITESKRHEQLRVLNRVLRHNVRNNVTALEGHVEFLEERVDDPTLRPSMDAITESARRIESISEKARTVQELLDQGDAVEHTDLDLASVVSDAVAAARQRFPAATIECDLDRPALARAVPELRTAIDELIENAVRHNDEDPTVEVRLDAGEDDVAVAVRDDGPGIPEEERRAIRSKAESPLEHGSGLGLWIADWIATDAGGDLSVEEFDGGTCATLVVPAASSDRR